LYKRAGYLITLTYAPSWEEKFGKKAGSLRAAGAEEFRKTAKKINRRAGRIGTEANYDERWGQGQARLYRRRRKGLEGRQGPEALGPGSPRRANRIRTEP
jgi:hypothetical protein